MRLKMKKKIKNKFMLIYKVLIKSKIIIYKIKRIKIIIKLYLQIIINISNIFLNVFIYLLIIFTL